MKKYLPTLYGEEKYYMSLEASKKNLQGNGTTISWCGRRVIPTSRFNQQTALETGFII